MRQRVLARMNRNADDPLGRRLLRQIRRRCHENAMRVHDVDAPRVDRDLADSYQMNGRPTPDTRRRRRRRRRGRNAHRRNTMDKYYSSTARMLTPTVLALIL
eukprot:1761117-Prymnesium_polylepis.1